MSDPHPEGHEPRPAGEATPPQEPAQPAPSETVPPAVSPARKLAIGLACTLAVILILVATAPFWAPALPWGAAHDDAELRQRLDRLEAAQRQSGGEQQRLDKLEAAQKDAQTWGQRLGGIETAQQQLDKKLAQLAEQGQAGVTAAVQPLDRRIATLEAKPAVAPDDVAALRQQLDKLSGTATDLAGRIDAIDKTIRANSLNDMSDLAVVLALLQIREAVDVGRPFAAEYELLAGIARNRPEIGLAVASLAGPARTGIATRAVLIARLHDLADTLAHAPAPVKNESWRDAALSRLSGLVTVRRVEPDGTPSPTTTGEITIRAAETALEAGDLGKAVADVGNLPGAASDQAGPWLRMAQARLAVEAALRRVETILLARLGKASPPPAASGSPG